MYPQPTADIQPSAPRKRVAKIIRFPAAVFARLKAHAATRSTNSTAVVVTAVERFLDEADRAAAAAVPGPTVEERVLAVQDELRSQLFRLVGDLPAAGILLDAPGERALLRRGEPITADFLKSVPFDLLAHIPLPREYDLLCGYLVAEAKDRIAAIRGESQ
jgi:hypothetical protein